MTKKIMFSEKYGLTQAVLEGRKTQTRRLLKHQPSSKDSKMLFYIFDDDRYYDNPEKDPLWGSVSLENPDGTKTEINKVAYLIGEDVAIAQSYDDIYMEKNVPCPIPEEYRLNAYNKGFNQGHKGWKNKLFVLPSDMPFRIKITNIRVERLQDISPEDCKAEGVWFNANEKAWYYGEASHYRVISSEPYDWKFLARLAFARLIDKVSGKGTWDSNPWVFVYDFKLVK